jgi:hypothetical protein
MKGGTKLMESNATYSTKQLIEELSNRKGVRMITTEPYQKFSIDAETEGIAGEGPAVILVVTV